MPILITRIFEGLCADLNGQLRVGDAILRVDAIDFRSVTHAYAVNVLKNTGRPQGPHSVRRRRRMLRMDDDQPSTTMKYPFLSIKVCSTSDIKQLSFDGSSLFEGPYRLWNRDFSQLRSRTGHERLA
jgi:hypothetical protein